MPPKTKGNRKGNDDWEAELGESIAPPSAAAAADEGANGAAADEDAAPVGGLMARMNRLKEKRKKKGLSEDFVDGESPAEPSASLADKAPVEATMEDEFALPEKKGKGGKGKQQQQQQDEKKDDDEDGDGRMLTKAEKEKLKKEREKQRKKEQVCSIWLTIAIYQRLVLTR